MGQRGELFSRRLQSSNNKRTYFLNLKENRTGDLYLTIVESKKHGETDFERRQVMIFEEDLISFERQIGEVMSFIRRRGRPSRRLRSE
jgi:hypothetical protein